MLQLSRWQYRKGFTFITVQLTSAIAGIIPNWYDLRV